VLEALEALDALAGRFAAGEMGVSLVQAASEAGLTYKQGVSEIARSRNPHHYTATWEGHRLDLGPHVALGSGSGAGFIARIYLHVADGTGDVPRGCTSARRPPPARHDDLTRRPGARGAQGSPPPHRRHRDGLTAPGRRRRAIATPGATSTSSPVGTKPRLRYSARAGALAAPVITAIGAPGWRASSSSSSAPAWPRRA
jgi:hypothetical protein